MCRYTHSHRDTKTHTSRSRLRQQEEHIWKIHIAAQVADQIIGGQLTKSQKRSLRWEIDKRICSIFGASPLNRTFGRFFLRGDGGAEKQKFMKKENSYNTIIRREMPVKGSPRRKHEQTSMKTVAPSARPEKRFYRQLFCKCSSYCHRIFMKLFSRL